jgi:sialate O-acetylesterase
MKVQLAVLLFFCVTIAFAQLRLPSLVSSGMVLQQNDSVKLWGWAGPDEVVYVTTGWDNRKDSTRANNGAKWSLKVKTPKAGGPYKIDIKTRGYTTTLNDVLIGEVWFCSGQSNMDWSYYHGLKDIRAELPTCYNKNIRFFHILKTTSDYPQDDVKGNWEICDSTTLKRFSAVGYFFGKRINQQLNVPVGLIHGSWGGTPAETWVPDSFITKDALLQEAANKLQTFKWWPSAAGKAYNAMVAPVTNFNIAGALWYQGEGNTGTNGTYYPLMVTLINSWRAAWKKDFYFNLVQIAPYTYGNHNVGALVQEAQTKLLSHPKTGVIVITDLVDNIKDIHPSNKHDVGLRLANWALGETYGVSGIAYKSPQFETMTVAKGKAALTFKNAPNGLISKDKLVSGFFVSGEKEQWFPAEAKIEGNKVTVWSKNVPAPAQVRFGFGNTVIGNVFSKEGLPVIPFRTDNWAVDQSAVKQ